MAEFGNSAKSVAVLPKVSVAAPAKFEFQTKRRRRKRVHFVDGKRIESI